MMLTNTTYFLEDEYFYFIVLKDLIGFCLIECLAEAASTHIEKALANNQIIIANVYFAHFFILALAGALISLTIY